MAATTGANNKNFDRPARKLTTYDLVIGILAIFSLILLIPLAFGKLPQSTADVLNAVEDLLCLIFLFDFFRSLRLAPKKWVYFLKGGGWLDLLGSIPLNGFVIFRVARLFRILRVMRKVTGGELRTIISRRLAQSTLLFTLVTALLLIFVVSWIVLNAEQGAPHANITTYQNAVWWAFVTITTVGYGDYYPVTNVGRIMAIILMFFGLGIIGVLSSYLAATFLTLEARRRERTSGERGGNEDGDDEEEQGEDDPTGLEAELAAMKEELAAIKRLLEQRSPSQ